MYKIIVSDAFNDEPYGVVGLRDDGTEAVKRGPANYHVFESRGDAKASIARWLRNPAVDHLGFTEVPII